MAEWQDEYRRMIDDCQARESALTGWETNFIQSLSEQLDKGRVLTSKQMEKLSDVWERVTSTQPRSL